MPYYLGQSRNKVKGNRSVGKSEKANPAILYKNELGLDKQTITQELNGLKLPGDQVWLLMRYKSRKVISPMHVHLRFIHYIILTFHALLCIKLKCKLF